MSKAMVSIFFVAMAVGFFPFSLGMTRALMSRRARIMVHEVANQLS